jgi:hypothetical protein
MPLSDLWSHLPERAVGHEIQDTPELIQAKRKLQTSNARAQSLVNKARRTASSGQGSSSNTQPESKADSFRKQWLNSHSTCIGHWLSLANGRSRAIYSHLSAFCKNLTSAFSSMENVRHMVVSNITDDTDVVVSNGQVSKSSRLGKVQIMNNIQEAVVQYDSPNEPSCHLCFSVHQPFMLLHGATGPGLFNRFTSWQLAFNCGVGPMFQKFNLSPSVFHRCKFIVNAMCRDALKANDVVRKGMRLIALRNNKAKRTRTDQPYLLLLDVRCVVHQFAITRKSIALAFDMFWSNAVRLGHLFESHAFRARFQQALVSVIVEAFEHIQVDSPGDLLAWYQHKEKHLALKNYPEKDKVSKQNVAIITVDNGNLDSLTFSAWNSSSSSAEDLILRMCTAYVERFGQGYPTPLLYRWKHGCVALRYLSEPLPGSLHMYLGCSFSTNEMTTIMVQ